MCNVVDEDAPAAQLIDYSASIVPIWTRPSVLFNSTLLSSWGHYLLLSLAPTTPTEKPTRVIASAVLSSDR